MYARTTDPETSHDAVYRIFTSTIRERIVEALMLHGPMTSHQIAGVLDVSLVTVSPMIKPLREAGKVIDTGEVRNRRSVWGVA